eukprot:3861644-Rhodomonas_salina.1
MKGRSKCAAWGRTSASRSGANSLHPPTGRVLSTIDCGNAGAFRLLQGLEGVGKTLTKRTGARSTYGLIRSGLQRCKASRQTPPFRHPLGFLGHPVTTDPPMFSTGCGTRASR